MAIDVSVQKDGAIFHSMYLFHRPVALSVS